MPGLRERAGAGGAGVRCCLWRNALTDMLPVALFKTMDVLDRCMQDNLSACQVSVVPLTHGSRTIRPPPLTPAFFP